MIDMKAGYYSNANDRNLISEMRIARNRKRREAIFRTQLVLLLITVTLILFLSIFMVGSVMSDAQSDTFEPQFKYYKSVTVHADDTLWDIARDYYAEDQYSDMSEYISEICSINRLGNVNMIKSGEELIIPYYSAEFK